jgi:hypothetical protein
MIVLDSPQLLSAVRRSLENHVLPTIDDEFARVQVVQALKALEEVGDRLENGDPCARSNENVEKSVRELADSLRSESPTFSASIDQALAEIAVDGDPRQRNRELGRVLWPLVTGGDEPGATRLLAILQAEAVRILGEDNRWLCPDAIVSLI